MGECQTTYTEECKPSYNYEKKCKKVPHQSCKYIDVPKYEQVPEEKCHYVNIPKKVPEQKCHYVTIPHCKKVPHQECHKEYKKKCHTIDIQVPVKKEVITCVWPEYRHHHDSTHC